jgi:hypothetical protein
MIPNPTELLRRAAECYLRGRDPVAACRCYEAARAHAEAARLHEQAGRFPAAATQFERAQAWGDAARCWVRAGEHRRAAELFLRAKDTLQGAWLLADQCGQGDRARAVALEFQPQTDPDRAAVGLILGRCDAGAGRWAAGAERLSAFTRQLEQLGPAVARLLAWGQAVGVALGRPDLIAEMFARAARARIPGAEPQWSAWALERLGDASEVPESTLPIRTAEPAGESPLDVPSASARPAQPSEPTTGPDSAPGTPPSST